MQVKKVEYNIIDQLSSKDQDYIYLKDFLRPFYQYEPELPSFNQAIEERKKYPIDRDLLVNHLLQQYPNPTDQQKVNIEELKDENTFTITTAHQPSLFGGPLYYILKIASTINLCNQLNKLYSDYHFIPVFISGGEDHDFEEINHLHLFGKEIIWDRLAEGPVGRLSLEGLKERVEEVIEILGSHPNAAYLKDLLHKSFEGAEVYGDFVFSFVNQLFGGQGLLVMNMDKKGLKSSFIPIMEEEILHRKSESIVLDTQKTLESKGFKAQAHPRDINLFFVDEDGRNRVTYKDGQYVIVDTSKSFSEDEIIQLLHDHPEKFSPNVVLRPLYQETILPNLAYIGGGGEISYWLERKTQFEYFKTFFPMLIRRNSAMILTKSQQKQMDGLGISIEKIFDHKDQIINRFLQRATETDITIDEERKMVEQAYHLISEKAKAIDPTLAKAIEADRTRQIKHIDQLESRIKRSVKSQEDINVNKIRKLKDKLFPGGGLQERHDNFMQFYLTAGPTLFDKMIEQLDPMDRRFTVFTL